MSAAEMEAAEAEAADVFREEEETGGRAEQSISSNAAPVVVAGAGAEGGERRGGGGLQTPPPVSPTAPPACSGPPEVSAGEEALRSCLARLEAGGFLRVCEGGKTFVCDDMMLVDQVRAKPGLSLVFGYFQSKARAGDNTKWAAPAVRSVRQ